ncbi:MAG: LPXTG cell wall anchor domain-containing protein [Clostridiales bacterium]|nr:LPXTG cell wall anchor domain-containing protein [Clostridiales bacterium]
MRKKVIIFVFLIVIILGCLRKFKNENIIENTKTFERIIEAEISEDTEFTKNNADVEIIEEIKEEPQKEEQILEEIKIKKQDQKISLNKTQVKSETFKSQKQEEAKIENKLTIQVIEIKEKEQKPKEDIKTEEINSEKQEETKAEISQEVLKNEPKEENKIKTVELQNEKKKGQIKVVKIDKDNNEVRLQGAIFEVYDEKEKLVDTLITNKKGEAVSKKLQIDQEYTVKEIKTLKTYVLSKEPQKVILKQDQITILTFENEKKKGQIEIIKIDAENKEVKLEGVTFEILDQHGNIVDTVITDKEGKALTKRLPIDGEFIVREKETKKEYILSDEKVKVVLEENEIKTITFENIKKKGSIKILKVSNGDNLVLNIPNETPLAGAKFTIVDGKGNIIGIYETDENGTVQIDNIPYGKYTIYESEVPEGYLMDAEPQTIFIAKNGEVIETIFKDSPIEPELPKTGIDININAAIIFVVLISVASIIALIKKYKKMEE